MIVKATLAIADDGQMRLAEPEPIVRADRLRFAPGSVEAASELAPYLPNAGVTVTGHARAQAVGATHGLVRLVVARDGVSLVDKSLEIMGDRSDPSSPPEPFDAIPILYERALGSPILMTNPVGLGADRASPNILNPRDSMRPGGFGPIAPSWSPRAQRIDEATRRALREPEARLPDAFDFAYFQAAPDDQTLPFLRGDETIVLDGMRLGTRSWSLRLPGLIARAARESTATAIDLVADMLAIDVDRAVATVVYRGSFALSGDANDVRVSAGIWVGSSAPLAKGRASTLSGGPSIGKPIVAPFPLAEPGDARPAPDLPGAPWSKSGPKTAPSRESISSITSTDDEAPREPVTLPPPPMDDARDALNDATNDELHEEIAEIDVEPDSAPTARHSAPVDLMEALAVDAAQPLVPPEPAVEVAPEIAPKIAPEVAAEPREEPQPAAREITLIGVRAQVLARRAKGEAIHDLHLEGADLHALDLDELSLERQVLRSAQLTSATLRRARLAGADLSGANLTNADLSGADLTGADLSRAVLTGAVLDRCKLDGANLTSARGDGASFVEASMNAVDLRQARLGSPNLKGAQLRGANATKADLRGAVFEGANLTDATMRGAKLRDSVMTSAILDGADLRDADLANVARDAASTKGTKGF